MSTHYISYNIFVYLFFVLAFENNVIQDNANNNIDKNELTCDFNHINSQLPNNNKMLSINQQPQLLSPSYVTDKNERTISSSSSEQLIPKERQTGKKKRSHFFLLFLLMDFIFFLKIRNVSTCIW